MTSRIKDPNFDDDPVSKHVHDPKGTFWFRRDKRPETTEDQEIKQLTNSNEVQNHEEKICGVQICKRRKRLLLMDQREREKSNKALKSWLCVDKLSFKLTWIFTECDDFLKQLDLYISFVIDIIIYSAPSFLSQNGGGYSDWMDNLLAVSFRDLVS